MSQVTVPGIRPDRREGFGVVVTEPCCGDPPGGVRTRCHETGDEHRPVGLRPGAPPRPARSAPPAPARGQGRRGARDRRRDVGTPARRARPRRPAGRRRHPRRQSSGAGCGRAGAAAARRRRRTAGGSGSPSPLRRLPPPDAPVDRVRRRVGPGLRVADALHAELARSRAAVRRGTGRPGAPATVAGPAGDVGAAPRRRLLGAAAARDHRQGDGEGPSRRSPRRALRGGDAVRSARAGGHRRVPPGLGRRPRHRVYACPASGPHSSRSAGCSPGGPAPGIPWPIGPGHWSAVCTGWAVPCGRSWRRGG